MSVNNPGEREIQRRLDFDGRNGHALWSEALVNRIEGQVSKELENAESFPYAVATSADCFAEDAELLAAFVEGVLNIERAKELSDHILACSACSNAVVDFARATQDMTASSVLGYDDEPVDADGDGVDDSGCDLVWADWFERIGLRPDGLTMFPDGTISDKAWEFGRLLDLNNTDARLCLIAEPVASAIRSATSSRRILLVAFSDAMHRLSVHVASRLKEDQHSIDVHVVGVKRYDEPTLLCKPSIVNGMTVFIITDVVRTGRLLERLWRIAEQHSPADVFGFAMVNQDYSGAREAVLTALVHEAKSDREQSGRKEEHFELRFFDPVSGRSRSNESQQHSAQWDLGGTRELLPFIERTGAFRRNHRIGANTYPFAIDVFDLLSDADCAALISRKTKQLLGEHDTNGSWVLVYPADRERRAGEIAKVVRGVTGWETAVLGNNAEAGFLDATDVNREKLESCDGAIVVDAAIRSGATLRSQLAILQDLGVSRVRGFYVLDLRRPRDIVANTQQMDIGIDSLFQVPLGFAPSESIKRLFKNRFRSLLSAVEASEYSETVKDTLRGFCSRMFEARRGGWSQSVHQEKIERNLEKGTTDPDEIVEQLAKGQRANFSLTGFLDAEQGLDNETQYRDAQYTINNSASPTLLRELALTLASHGDYGWFNKGWLLLHEHLLRASDMRWDFLPAVALDAVLRNPSAAEDMLASVIAYEDSLEGRAKRKSTAMLFDTEHSDGVAESRCAALKEILRDQHVTSLG